ncbi:acyl-CoA thioesterase [Propionicicella superfundia]|uniref:acyl-CoA thioesterase n=1 Tax=Propionicicella superfundia TaxID=348582 RepID=UPI0003FE0F30|nr:hotdog domain-containing protein [Propionicicella superfundia]
MEIVPVTASHLVMSGDLNHHGTLFAGQCALWFVEAGLMAASRLVPARNVVCVNVHGFTFTRPVALGEMVVFAAKVVLTGRSSMIAHIAATAGGGGQVVSGFVTFVNVDEEGRPAPHGAVVEATTPVDVALRDRAAALRR